MRNFVLTEELYDKRFMNKKHVASAYAEASKNYLSEYVIKRTTKKERVTLMVLAERLDVHPMTLVNEGLWDSFKDLIGVGNKAAQTTEEDPEATEKEKKIAAELERLSKQGYGIGKRWAANKEAEGTWWQGVKHTLGAMPNLFVQGQHVIPGTKQGNKLRAKANVAFQDLKKQLTDEFGNVFKDIVAGLKELGSPTAGGFPNSPNSKDFLKVMYGTPFFEDLTPQELGGLAGKILEIRSSLEAAVKSGVIDNKYANKIMKKGIKILEYYMGSMEENYMSTLENKGQGNNKNLLRNASRYSLVDSMIANDYWLNQFLTEETVPSAAVLKTSPGSEKIQAQQDTLQSNVEQEFKQEGGMSKEELKALFGSNPKEKIAKIAAGLATGKLGDDLDPDILKKTDLSANAKKFIIMAAVGAAMAAIGYALGGSFGIDKIYGQVQDSMADKWEDLDLRQSLEVAQEETIKKTTEALESNSSVLKGEGLTQLTKRDFNMSQEQIDKMGWKSWWNLAKEKYGSDPEKMKQAFGDRMNDPKAFFKMAEEQAQTNPGVSVEKMFSPSHLGSGATGTSAFSLFTGGIKTWVTKQVTSQMKKTAVKQIGAVMWTKVSGASFAAAVSSALPSILLTVGVPTAIAAGAIAALRKFKNSRGKQLKALIDIVSKPIKVPFGTEKVLKAQETMGIDPIVDPDEIPKEDKQSSTEGFGKSLELVYRAMGKAGYKKEEAEKIMKVLFSEEDPFKLARAQLTSDNNSQELMRTSAWRKYSLSPLLTENPLLGLLNEEPEIVYGEFSDYMTKAAKKAAVTIPNEKQIKQAAVAFNLANGIGDISDLPPDVANIEALSDLEKLRNKLASKSNLHDKQIQRYADEVKDATVKHAKEIGVKEDVIKKMEEQIKALKDGSQSTEQLIMFYEEEVSGGRIKAEQAEAIRLNLEKQLALAANAKNETEMKLNQKVEELEEKLANMLTMGAASGGARKEIEDILSPATAPDFDFMLDGLDSDDLFQPDASDKEKDDLIKKLEKDIDELTKKKEKEEQGLTDLAEFMLYFGAQKANPSLKAMDNKWPSLANASTVDDVQNDPDFSSEFTKALAAVGSYMGDTASNPNVKKIGKLIAAMGDDAEEVEEVDAEKKKEMNMDPVPKSPSKRQANRGRSALGSSHKRKGQVIKEHNNYNESLLLERWQKLSGLESE
jgi:hypothetical protein